MMRFMLLFSRQGKLRLQKWYTATAERDKKKMVRELMQVVLARKPKMCSFLEWRDLKIVYKSCGSCPYSVEAWMLLLCAKRITFRLFAHPSWYQSRDFPMSVLRVWLVHSPNLEEGVGKRYLLTIVHDLGHSR
ncbi:uncharacterized protein LOC121571295 isoform X3 [Coregonus clupeaformis]|uniref:uncharacterized protein LOC121571295 isoform X3 n=1 Tax=Coregonus clupeaformis TaxID=59861 RepID=UPI001BE0FCAF|nr:uncharacterized protein LOC121571295 isoform X3 [Coregonus clupeaformis]